MAELLTSAQMRAIEAAAIGSGAVSGRALMERAGCGVVEAVFSRWPELAPEGWSGAVPRDPSDGSGACGGQGGGAAPAPPEDSDRDEGARRAVVFCGPGNNGGDGFVVARLLAELGWAVEVYLSGDAARLPPDARVNWERWRALGAVRPLGSAEVDLAGCDLAVDALFGTGLTRPLEGALGHVADALAGRAFGGAPVVAVDAPSGMCMDSGRGLRVPGGAGVAAARLTVSFHALKLGHVLAEGPERCGVAVVADIGLPGGSDADGARLVTAPRAEMIGKSGAAAHKYDHGHALVLAGGSGTGGAARLAARSALRVGAGLVTLAPAGAAVVENAAQLNAIMLRPVDDAPALVETVADRRFTALCLGPGLGLDRTRDLLAAALGAGRPTVLDADALTILAEDPEAWFVRLHRGCVLTPHAGEFARLFPDLAETLGGTATVGPATSKVDATRDAAARAGCTVLLKGPDTVICDPVGEVRVHAAVYDRAAPWLATAGSGDVLAGMITGLLARGFGAVRAAESAAWLHAEAARRFGPGLIAEDLPEELPRVFRALGL